MSGTGNINYHTNNFSSVLEASLPFYGHTSWYINLIVECFGRPDVGFDVPDWPSRLCSARVKARRKRKMGRRIWVEEGFEARG